INLQPLPCCELHRHDGAAAVNEQPAAAIELLQNEPLAAEEARADLPGKGDVQVEIADGAKKRVLLAEQLLTVEFERDDLAGIRSGERHPPGLPHGAEMCDEEALAGEQLSLEAAKKAPFHPRIHLD